MALLPSILDAIKATYYSLPHGMQGKYLDTMSKELGRSKRSLERDIKRESMPEEQKNKRVVEPKHPEYREWAKYIAMIKKRPPEEAGEISTEDAVKIAVESELIPKEALSVGRRTFDRIIAEMGLNKAKKVTVRYQAEYANKAHHFDASSSKFLYVAKYIGKEPILKLFRPAKYYKNKPTPMGVRPWAYGLVDDYSGKTYCRYTIAMGESMDDSVMFLANYGWRNLGLPEILMADQGLLKKGLASQDFIARLNIEFPESKPYAKEAHGKIERTWRTLWKKFELVLFAMNDWKTFEITLTELNERLERYIEEYNSKPHRYEKNYSRENMWHSSLMLMGGKITIPEDALTTVCRREKRKITKDGTLQYDSNLYTVKGCYDEWVYVFEGIFADKTVVQCIRTGERFEAKPQEVLTFGEYLTIPETSHQKAVKESQNINVTKILYTEDKAPTNIEKIPLRQTEQSIVNPMDTSIYSSIDKAMADFLSLINGTIKFENPESLEKLREAIIKNGLKKQFVKESAEKLIKNANTKIG